MKPTQDMCFLITAYEDTHGIKRNIRFIRKKYKELTGVAIIIVSTSDNPSIFNFLKTYPNVYFIPFTDAPGSKNNTSYKSRDNGGPYWGWHSEFLPPRILMSIELGLKKAIELNKKICFHIHADTYWRPAKIKNLINEMSVLIDQNLLMIADMSVQNEVSARNHNGPRYIAYQPEGMLLNIAECQRTGYGITFSKIFDEKSGFVSQNYGCIEILIGQYAIYCLSKKNITKQTDVLPKIYDEKVRTRMSRDYHGYFKSGLRNIPPPERSFKLSVRRIIHQIKNYVQTPYELKMPSKTESNWSNDVLPW